MSKKKVDLVNALILDNNNHALLVYKYSGALNNSWGFPGGNILGYEEPQKAVIRRVHEELGLGIKIVKRNGSKVFGDYETRTLLGDFLSRIYHAEIIRGPLPVARQRPDCVSYFNHARLLRLNEERILAQNVVLSLPKLKDFMD